MAIRSTSARSRARSGASTRSPGCGSPHQQHPMMTTGFPCSAGGTKGTGGATAAEAIIVNSSGTWAEKSRKARNTSAARSALHHSPPARTVDTGCSLKWNCVTTPSRAPPPRSARKSIGMPGVGGHALIPHSRAPLPLPADCHWPARICAPASRSRPQASIRRRQSSISCRPSLPGRRRRRPRRNPATTRRSPPLPDDDAHRHRPSAFRKDQISSVSS